MISPVPKAFISRDFDDEDPGLRLVYVLGRLAVLEQVRQRHWEKLREKIKKDGGRDPDD